MRVPEKWKQEVQEYQASNLSQKGWCRQRGISSGGFCYRLKRVREEAAKGLFCELKSKTSGIRIRWGYITVEIDPYFDVKALEGVLKALHVAQNHA